MTSRGFITLAQNSPTGNYVRAAYGLALSLKRTQKGPSGLSIVVTPGTIVPEEYRSAFDQIIDVPWSDMAKNVEWKIHNKWKVFHVSPYDETILLDADMLFGADISDWWGILGRRDVFACTTPYTFRGEPITNSVYREKFDQMGLPHVYTAFLYFRKTKEAQRYFWFVEHVYKGWTDVIRAYPGLSGPVSGDLAFATGMVFADRVREFTSSGFPGIIHMKTTLQDIGPNVFEDWTQHLNCQIQQNGSIFVGGYRQLLPFHYHVKTFLTDQIIHRLSDV